MTRRKILIGILLVLVASATFAAGTGIWLPLQGFAVVVGIYIVLLASFLVVMLQQPARFLPIVEDSTATAESSILALGTARPHRPFEAWERGSRFRARNPG